MKLTGEVIGQESTGDEIAVTIGNVHAENGATWRQYMPGIKFRVPESKGLAYRLGRKVVVTIQVK